MIAIIDGQQFRIEFSYRRRDGKAASLARHSPIAGISACAIVADHQAALNPVLTGIVSVAAVVCSAGDNWNRRTGRALAFQRAVRECGELRKQADAFGRWYAERFPDRAKRPHPPKFSLSLEQIAARRDAGEAKRKQRTAARGGAA